MIEDNNEVTEIQKGFADYPLNQDMGAGTLKLSASVEEIDVMQTIKRAIELLESTNKTITQAKNKAFKSDDGPKIIVQQEEDLLYYAFDENTADGAIDGNMCSGSSASKIYAVMELIEELYESETYTEKELLESLNIKR